MPVVASPRRPSPAMKPSPAQTILAVLLCQVFAVTQVFAIAGGPPVGTGGFAGGGAALNLTGTYSGVLQGLTETSSNNGSGGTTTASAANSIGLFNLGITQTTGLATGSFLLFADGRVFTGSLTGTVDPSSGGLRGILKASFNFNTTSVNAAGVAVTVPVVATAAGQLDTVISGATSGNVTTAGGTTTTTAGNALVTLAGTARLDLNFGGVDATTLQPVVDRTLTFSVNGFRNSTSVVPTALTAGGG